jgi:cell wall-associated NlpC family hydrolase
VPQTRHIALTSALAAVVGTGAVVAVGASSSTPVAAAAAPFAKVDLPAPQPSVMPTSFPVPTPEPVKALVAVSVAPVWGGRHKVRSFDAPAMQRPARPGAWLRGMTFYQRSHLFKRLATQVRYGDPVVIVDTWRDLSRIRIPGQTGGRFPDGIIGWIASRQLAPEPAGWDAAKRVATVTAKTATLRRVVHDKPHATTVSYATTLPLVAVRAHRVVVAVPGSAGRGTLRRSAVSVHKPGAAAIKPSGRKVLAEAKRFLGLPYLWAGMTSWGFDCSGLTSAVFSQLGVRLARDAADQSFAGKPVRRSKLRVGDLVFFSHTPRRGDIHHVGIYAGRGRVLDAPYTGARVEIVSLRHSYLNDEYWGASRPLPTR